MTIHVESVFILVQCSSSCRYGNITET